METIPFPERGLCMFESAKDRIAKTLSDIRESGLWKDERVLLSPQEIGRASCRERV